MKHSAGIIAYRKNDKGELEFFVGHPGGNKYYYWAFLKGLVEDGEDVAETAIREFREECGQPLEWLTPSDLTLLGTIRQSVHKKVTVFALEYGDIDPDECFSNLADNGKVYEIDKYKWMTYDELKDHTHPTHLILYQKIKDKLN